jgi:hypothetical protein
MIAKLTFYSGIGCFQGDRIFPCSTPSLPSGSDTEQICWQPVMMPSGYPYPGIDYWMPH